MELRRSRHGEEETILSLYRSVLGEEFCVWNEYYPGMLEIRADLASGGLWLLCNGETILGAISAIRENEMDEMSCWHIREHAREIARVVIGKEYRGRGLAGEMVKLLLPILRREGAESVHLSAATGNLPAVRTYEKLGFERVGEADMYEGHYYLMELSLREEKDNDILRGGR